MSPDERTFFEKLFFTGELVCINLSATLVIVQLVVPFPAVKSWKLAGTSEIIGVHL